MTEEIEPHILKKFEIIEKLGKGAYGIVWKAIDRKLKQVVALKKVLTILLRSLTHSTMQQMHKERLEKSCSCNNSMVKLKIFRA
jgi:serine/threonine protein kinase